MAFIMNFIRLHQFDICFVTLILTYDHGSIFLDFCHTNVGFDSYLYETL